MGKPNGAPINGIPDDIEAIAAALSAPFDLSEVQFKPAVVTGNRALALAYVDARSIQDRLDDVLGIDGWHDSYRVLPDGSVMCRLRLKIGEQWITKVDVGGQSEQPDGGDRTKAAFSDALKRAAVKFGIGRYLYRLPSQWCDYDPHKREFIKPPTLPSMAGPVTIDAAGAAALNALATKKGKTVAELLNVVLARKLWRQLAALPDAVHNIK